MSASAVMQPGSVQRDTKQEQRVISEANPSDSLSAPISLHEDIARLAYICWQQRGCPEGSPEEDWMKAEEQMRGSSKRPSTLAEP